MINQRRKQLNNISARIGRIAVPADIDELESIKSEIEDVLWDEQMAFDNMPESLQDSMRGEMSQDAQSNMEDAISRIEDFIADYENEAENEETEDKDQLEEEEAELAQRLLYMRIPGTYRGRTDVRVFRPAVLCLRRDRHEGIHAS